MTIQLDHVIVSSRDKAASAQRLAEPTDSQVRKEYGNVYWNEPDGHFWEMLTVSYARKPG